MNKTVLITGASTGIGRECAEKFAKMGWNVVATMRSPEKEKELITYSNVFLTKLDVRDSESIAAAVNAGIEKFGRIDVLINNAGYYSIGVIEAIDEEEIFRQIDTNLIGLIRVTKAVLPHMRKERSGVIINLSSVAGRTTVPLQSIYHATKWGVEGFSQSLQYEVAEFGIDVVLVEPGVIKTDFYERSMKFSEDKSLKDYERISESVSKYLINGGRNGSLPEAVAEDIYKIAVAKKRKMQYPTGKSTGIIFLHKILPHRMYVNAIKSTMIKE